MLLRWAEFFWMKAYSLDLRERVVAAVEAGEMSRQRVAKVFGVSYYWIKKLFRQKRERGSIAPLPHGGGQKPLLDESRRKRLRRELERHPDATLEELCGKVPGAEGRPVSVPTMSRTLRKLGLTRKKEGAFGHRAGPAAACRALGAHGGTPGRSAPAHLY